MSCCGSLICLFLFLAIAAVLLGVFRKDLFPKNWFQTAGASLDNLLDKASSLITAEDLNGKCLVGSSKVLLKIADKQFLSVLNDAGYYSFKEGKFDSTESSSAVDCTTTIFNPAKNTATLLHKLQNPSSKNSSLTIENSKDTITFSSLADAKIADTAYAVLAKPFYQSKYEIKLDSSSEKTSRLVCVTESSLSISDGKCA
jgi:hypothetical protein